METLVRGATQGDLGFILSTMPRSLRYHSEFWESTENSRFHKMTFELIKRIALNPSVSLRILCDKEDPTIILAYVVMSLNEPNRALIYAYTKPPFRRQGYINQLIADARVDQVAYITKKLNNLRVRKKLELNPWILLDLLTKGDVNV